MGNCLCFLAAHKGQWFIALVLLKQKSTGAILFLPGVHSFQSGLLRQQAGKAVQNPGIAV
jgi:hypothetical protein